jgi:hypothetical protein
MEEGKSYTEEEVEVAEQYKDYDQTINWDLDTLDFNFASGKESYRFRLASQMFFNSLSFVKQS